MSPSSRRVTAGLVRLGLVVLAIAVVATYVRRKVSVPAIVSADAAPSPDSLGPGDLRIYNADSTIDLVLKGDRILAGLSPKMVAQIQAELDTSSSKDTSGLGGSITRMVKQTVAGAIGTHASFALSDLREIRYEHNELVFDWHDNRDHSLFKDAKVNGKKASRSFGADDARRFIDAVQARKRSLGESQ